ncbi:hypothetical protein [Aliivibrio fischeri]|uniref:hypothetical protein n=1 Tax=Aliivibrio fischeri TaxID=668 RepID=UPI0012D94164|nr:hypothetical protein [Aliivibrio fischeri]MUJ20466.1 hypothetical protein [Aliivibrio fischeri]
MTHSTEIKQATTTILLALYSNISSAEKDWGRRERNTFIIKRIKLYLRSTSSKAMKTRFTEILVMYKRNKNSNLERAVTSLNDLSDEEKNDASLHLGIVNFLMDEFNLFYKELNYNSLQKLVKNTIHIDPKCIDDNYTKSGSLTKSLYIFVVSHHADEIIKRVLSYTSLYVRAIMGSKKDHFCLELHPERFKNSEYRNKVINNELKDDFKFSTIDHDLFAKVIGG